MASSRMSNSLVPSRRAAGKSGSPRWAFTFAVASMILLLVVVFTRSWDLDYFFRNEDTLKSRQQTTKTNNTAITNASHNKPIRQISILGERNSGTRWTYDHLEECFGHEISVKKELTRYKHWFQNDSPSRYPHDTLVVAQFRNPYDWLKAMEHVPHHSPAHLRTALTESNKFNVTNENSANNDWRVFLTKPWTMDRVGSDLWPNRTSDTMCQEHFKLRDIISCDVEPLPHSYYNNRTIVYSEDQPFYEMRNDGSGRPYKNILEMRSDKIRNFLSVIDFEGVADMWVVQYEFLVDKGTQSLIDRIAEKTGVTPKCDPKPPQPRQPKKSRRISPDFAHHIRLNLNWTVEEMVGYKPELRYEVAKKYWR